MRKTTGIALAAALAMSAVLGCGGKMDPPGELYKEPRLSVYLYAGGYADFEGATSVGVTGGRLFAAFPEERDVNAYYSHGTFIPDITFDDLTSPFTVGIGRTEIAVVDTADTIRVKVYGVGGGEVLRAAADTDWVEVGGVAVDDDGNIYVSDSKRNFIRSYDTAGNLRFGEDLADSGFGIGHVLAPRGIFIEGDTLYIAEGDGEKAQVQRISTREPQVGIPFSETTPYLSTFIDTLGIELPLIEPVAVCVNVAGQIFVLDAGYGVIVEYNRDGSTNAIVTAPTSGGPFPLDDANSIGTYSNRVYALELSTGTVHRWDKGPGP